MIFPVSFVFWLFGNNKTSWFWKSASGELQIERSQSFKRSCKLFFAYQKLLFGGVIVPHSREFRRERVSLHYPYNFIITWSHRLIYLTACLVGTGSK